MDGTFLAVDREKLIEQALFWRDAVGIKEPMPIDTSVLLNVVLRATAEELRAARSKLEHRRQTRQPRRMVKQQG